MKNKKLVAVLTATALAATLSACAGGAATGGSSDKIKIGIKFDQPGLGLKTGDAYSGFDVDVATYIAQKLGKTPAQIEWVQSISSQREDMIANDQVKMIVATYSITDSRKEKVSFAGPYFIAGQDLLVRADDASITGPDALAGKKLCSVTGSTSAQKVKDQYPDVQLQEMGTYSECVAALVSGGIDALTTDDTILAGYAAQEQYKGKLKVVGKPFSTENYGVGVKKGDKAFCEQVSTAIKDMVSDGSWQSYVDKNFGPASYKPGTGNPPTPAACS